MHFEIKKILKVSPADFYDYMVETIIEQIEQDLDVKLKPEDIKAGYTHRVKSTNKKSGKVTRTRYTIKDAKRPERFVVVFSTAEHTSKVIYEFRPTDKENQTDFTYIMDTTYVDPSLEQSGWKAKLAERSARSRFARSIKSSERDCIKKLKEKGDEPEEEIEDLVLDQETETTETEK